MARKPSASIRGGLIGIEPDGIIGWAVDPAAPEQPVHVRLMAGGQLVAEALANLFDDPRVRILAGPGIPGFSARLAVAPAARFPLALTLHDASGSVLGPPLPVNAAADLAPVTGPPPPGSYEGNVDGIYAGALMGWARDTAHPDASVELELLDTGVGAGRATAHLLREDLRVAGLHHGLYGFSFDLPATLLDGRAHSLSVRVANSQTVLPGGPVSFGPLATSALMSQVTALQGEVAVLRQVVEGLTAPDGPVQRRILRTLAERIAALGEIQRDHTEREMAALRAMVFAAGPRPVGVSGTAPEQYGTAQTSAARG